jgi:hypothetical protein
LTNQLFINKLNGHKQILIIDNNKMNPNNSDSTLVPQTTLLGHSNSNNSNNNGGGSGSGNSGSPLPPPVFRKPPPFDTGKYNSICC